MKRANKYKAKKTWVDGIQFDSRREASRYSELRLLEKAGVIANLELQPKFPLEVAGNAVRYDNGRQAVYIADFAYWDSATEKRVVEDSKGYKTPVYKLKRAIVHAMHPAVRIVEV